MDKLSRPFSSEFRLHFGNQPNKQKPPLSKQLKKERAMTAGGANKLNIQKGKNNSQGMKIAESAYHIVGGKRNGPSLVNQMSSTGFPYKNGIMIVDGNNATSLSGQNNQDNYNPKSIYVNSSLNLQNPERILSLDFQSKNNLNSILNNQNIAQVQTLNALSNSNKNS